MHPSYIYLRFWFVVGWLINVPPTCWCIAGKDLLTQLSVLLHTQRQKLQIKLTISSSHSMLTLGQPVQAILQDRAAGRVPLFEVAGVTWRRKAGIWSQCLPLSRQRPHHYATQTVAVPSKEKSSQTATYAVITPSFPYHPPPPPLSLSLSTHTHTTHQECTNKLGATHRIGAFTYQKKTQN